MNIDEYIELANIQLQELKKAFEEGYKKDPDMWPKELAVSDWIDQELTSRFNILP
jgi:carbamate kinase